MLKKKRKIGVASFTEFLEFMSKKKISSSKKWILICESAFPLFKQRQSIVY